MKRIIAVFLSLGLFIAACTPAALKAPPASATDPFAVSWDDRSIFKSGLVEAEQPVLDERKDASIYHLTFNIDNDMYHVSGREEVRYTNAETVALHEVEFHLFPNLLGGEMQVRNLQVDNKAVTPKYDLQNSLMIVPLTRALSPGESLVLQMDFAVVVPQTVDQYYGVLAYYDNVLALAHAYPMISVYDDQGWHAEIPSLNGDVTFNDASFYVVSVTAPKNVTLVASGRRISSDEAEQSQTMMVASGPARDFYLVASPHYQEVSKSFGAVTIHSYAPGSEKDGAQFALEVASRAIDVYSQHYAPYPYTDLNIVATPNTALGIEYPGMIAIAKRIYDVRGEYAGAPASVYMEATVAHEVGHQWFYNLVGNDQLNNPWLDESLAQFATLQYYMDEYGTGGADGFRSSLDSRWARVDNATIPIGLPVAGYSSGEYGAIVYGRGPLFFVALRDKMGATAFDEFLKNYVGTFSWGIATPKGLQSLAEQSCGCDLQAMFDEWVYP